MKIAVTYENGDVFQHFGHTQQFKVYEVRDGKVADMRIVSAEAATAPWRECSPVWGWIR